MSPAPVAVLPMSPWPSGRGGRVIVVQGHVQDEKDYLSRPSERPAETAQQASYSSWISKTADRCGGEACIRDTRIPVWVLENYRRLAGSTTDILRAYPSLKPADLDAAWEFAARNPDEIDRAIRENEQGEEGLVE